MVGPELRVVAFLLNALWQATLLAALGLLAARLLREAPAAFRHRIWVATLVLAALAPLGSLIASGPDRGSSRSTPPREARKGLVVLSDAELGAGAKSLGLGGMPTARGAGALVAILYLAAVAARGGRLLTGWRRTSRLVAAATMPARAMSRAVAEMESKLGGQVPVRVSREIVVPMTFGLTSPTVVVPEALTTRPAHELHGLLAHELAHVARRDCAVHLFCEVVSLPLWFHPAVRFVKRRIGGAREAACDEAAAAWVGPGSYARTLISVASRACRPAPASALGILDGDSLEERMKRILEPRAGMGRRAAMALLLVGVAGLAVAARLTSSAGLVLAAEAGPDDMKGRWSGTLSGGPRSGQPAADLSIRLTPSGPAVSLTLYRYDRGADPKAPATKEVLPAVQHRVEKGVLRFRTRTENFRIHPDDPPSPTEADWQFALVGKEVGELTLLRNSKLEADKAKGIDVPPPPPPLAMTRSSRE